MCVTFNTLHCCIVYLHCHSTFPSLARWWSSGENSLIIAPRKLKKKNKKQNQYNLENFSITGNTAIYRQHMHRPPVLALMHLSSSGWTAVTGELKASYRYYYLLFLPQRLACLPSLLCDTPLQRTVMETMVARCLSRCHDRGGKSSSRERKGANVATRQILAGHSRAVFILLTDKVHYWREGRIKIMQSNTLCSSHSFKWLFS